MEQIKEINKPTVDTEIVFKTPLNKVLITPIGFNYEEVKRELIAVRDYAISVTYSEEQIKEAAKSRAKLNNLSKTIKSEITSIRAKSLEMCSLAESQLKECAGLINEGSTAIDKQVKAFEEKQDTIKQEAIGFFFNAKATELMITGVIKLDQLWNSKWLNKGEKLPTIELEITTRLIKIIEDLKVISTLDSEYEAQIKDKYLFTLDLATALNEKSRLEARAEQLKVVEQIVKPQVNVPTEPIREPQAIVEEQLQQFTFTIRVNPEQKEAFIKCLKDNDIKVLDVKKGE